MKIGDLVKHRTSGEIGIVTRLLDDPFSLLVLVYVRKMNGTDFPHPAKILDVLSENG